MNHQHTTLRTTNIQDTTAKRRPKQVHKNPPKPQIILMTNLYTKVYLQIKKNNPTIKQT